MKPNTQYWQGNYQLPQFPMTVANSLQGSFEWDGSHRYSQAYDFSGANTGISPVYAPCDLVIKYIGSYNQGHDIFWESYREVLRPDGTIGYIRGLFIHANDVSHLHVGQRWLQGEHFYNEGTAGLAYGNHIHVEVGFGKTQIVNNRYYETHIDNNGVEWHRMPNAVPINKIFFIDDTQILNNSGYGMITAREAKNGWIREDGDWYYYVAGTAKLGWHNDVNGSRYYLLPPSGAMAYSRWELISEKWYLFNPDGRMVRSTIVGDWEFDDEGVATPIVKPGEPPVDDGWQPDEGLTPPPPTEEDQEEPPSNEVPPEVEEQPTDPETPRPPSNPNKPIYPNYQGGVSVMEKLNICLGRIETFEFNSSLSQMEMFLELIRRVNELINRYGELSGAMEDIIVDQLNTWINDGTLADIINRNIFDQLNLKITTLENLVETKFQEIQRQMDMLAVADRLENAGTTYVAHRGMSGLVAENTILAAQKAYHHGFDVVEIDIQLTKDGYWILMHDTTVDRTTDGVGNVVEKTLAQIKALTVDHTGDKGLKVPELGEFFKELNGLPLRYVIELKTPYTPTNSQLNYLISLLKYYGVYSKTIIQSFTKAHLTAIRNLDKKICLGLLGYPLTAEMQDEMLSLRPLIWHTDQTLATDASQIGTAKQNNYLVGAYTIDDFGRCYELEQVGIDFITSNIIGGRTERPNTNFTVYSRLDFYAQSTFQWVADNSTPTTNSHSWWGSYGLRTKAVNSVDGRVYVNFGDLNPGDQLDFNFEYACVSGQAPLVQIYKDGAAFQTYQLPFVEGMKNVDMCFGVKTFGNYQLFIGANNTSFTGEFYVRKINVRKVSDYNQNKEITRTHVFTNNGGTLETQDGFNRNRAYTTIDSANKWIQVNHAYPMVGGGGHAIVSVAGNSAGMLFLSNYNISTRTENSTGYRIVISDNSGNIVDPAMVLGNPLYNGIFIRVSVVGYGFN